MNIFFKPIGSSYYFQVVNNTILEVTKKKKKTKRLSRLVVKE